MVLKNFISETLLFFFGERMKLRHSLFNGVGLGSEQKQQKVDCLRLVRTRQ